MAEAICCNYARTAVRSIDQGLYAHGGNGKTLPSGALKEIEKQYHQQFKDTPAMHLSNQAAKLVTIKKLLKTFNEHWCPQASRITYLDTFSTMKWNALSKAQQAQHTLQKCKACQVDFPELTAAFPTKRCTQNMKKTITITQDDLSSPAKLGQSVVKQLDIISQQNFGQSAQSVLTSTSKTNLVVNPGRTERQQQLRTVVRKVKKDIQDAMNESSLSSVMANRMSWTKYDSLRKSTLTERQSVKRGGIRDENETPAKKSKHTGSIEDSTELSNLIQEAKSWPPQQPVNWSQLARRCGISKPNGGQMIKEAFKQHGIPAANEPQREKRKQRRRRKTLPGNIPFPMQLCPRILKAQLKKEIEKGTILIGEEVVPTQYTSYKVNTGEKLITEEKYQVKAQKIPLLEIRRRLLKHHEELGLIRNKPDEYYDKLTIDEQRLQLKALGENEEIMSDEEAQQHFKNIGRQRFF